MENFLFISSAIQCFNVARISTALYVLYREQFRTLAVRLPEIISEDKLKIYFTISWKCTTMEQALPVTYTKFDIKAAESGNESEVLILFVIISIKEMCLR